MISIRNMNQVKFQKRLIRAAAQSPKLEAAHLFSIVARNLEEFLTVRVPLDGDTDAALSEYVELMELLIHAVARKFPTLYSDHQIDNVSGLTLIDDEVKNFEKSMLLTDDDRAELSGKDPDWIRARIIFNIINELLLRGEPYPTMTQGGLYAHNHRFYHGYVWLMELARGSSYNTAVRMLYGCIDELTMKLKHHDSFNLSDSYKYLKNDIVPEVLNTARDAASGWMSLLRRMNQCVTGNPNVDLPVVPELHVARLNSIVAPDYTTTDQTVCYESTRRWVQQKNSNASIVMVTFQWSPYQLMRDSDEEDLGPIRLASRNFTDDVGGPVYNFVFEVDNPIAMNMPAVMEALTSRRINDYSGLVYEDDEKNPKVAAFRGPDCRTSATYQDAAPLLMRGPIGPDHRTGNVIHEMIQRIDCDGDVESLFDQMVYDDNGDLRDFTTMDVRQLASAAEVRNMVACRHNDSSHFWVSYGNMTVYRVDSLPSMPNEPMKGEGLAFILMMAALLKSRLRIYVECRARGDEENNLRLVSMLQNFGADVRVAPSNKKFVGCKVHAKIWSFQLDNCRTFDRVNLFSTGNFSTEAMQHFSDCYYIEKATAPENIAVDNFFDCLFNGAKPLPYEARWSMFWVPTEIRRKILDEINWVVSNHRGHYGYGRIVVKVNHLMDSSVCRALADAADAGVEVVVVARTTCAIPTFRSEHMTVKSFCGKVLEHDRFFIFSLWNRIDDQSDETHAYIGSADMMRRNLTDRIEFLKRVDGPETELLVDVFDDVIGEIETDPKVGFFVTRL